jgi:4-amino-4-deoxy-L-arabinose transferase-like glycosyltransferase
MTTELRSRAEGEVDFQPTGATMIGLFGAFVIIWALYFTITEAPVAIKHDMAEAYAWGQEFQLGYTQHPPFWAWICGLWFLLLPRTGWAFALLSSLNAAIGLCGAWMLIGDFAAGRKRMAAWVLLLLTPLYTFYAYKYDANIIFLSLWPWTQHYFVRSVRRRASGDAVMFGLLIGLALMSKYYAAILLATNLLAALLYQPWRRYLVSSAPYVSAFVAATVCAPHIWWLVAHQGPPLRYLANISGQRWGNVAGHATKTLLEALGMQLGVLVIVGYVAVTSKRVYTAVHDQPTSRAVPAVLATLALAPLALTVASALALRTDVTPEMTIGTFALLPLLILEVARITDLDRLCRNGARLAGVLTVGALVLSPAIALERTFLSPNAMKAEPFQEVASEATKLWHDHTSLPLTYVAGSTWYVNTIAFYSSDRPHVFVYFDYSHNLWVTPNDLRTHGLLAVCVSDDSPCLAATARFATPAAARTEISLAHKFWGHVAKPVHFVITVIPPPA